MKLRRRSAPFYLQPWFWTLAIVVGQYYGVWWQSLGIPQPKYVMPRYVIASVQDPFTITITAPGYRGAALRRATN